MPQITQWKKSIHGNKALKKEFLVMASWVNLWSHTQDIDGIQKCHFVFPWLHMDPSCSSPLKSHPYPIRSRNQSITNFILLHCPTITSKLFPINAINLRQRPCTLPWLWPSAFSHLQNFHQLGELRKIKQLPDVYNSKQLETGHPCYCPPIGENWFSHVLMWTQHSTATPDATS